MPSLIDMSCPPTRKIAFGFGLALVVLAAVVCEGWITGQLREAALASARAEHVIVAAKGFHLQVVNTEKAIYLYLKTGDARFLADHQRTTSAARHA